jgi:hypothetical protein
MTTREFLHERGAKTLAQYKTMFRRSANGRIFLRLLIAQYTSRVGGEIPMHQYFVLEDLLSSIEDSSLRSRVKRFFRQHGPFADGETKTLPLWSSPGAVARGERLPANKTCFTLSQEFVRFLLPILLYHRGPTNHHLLRRGLAISRSSWSNISSSLRSEEVMGDWRIFGDKELSVCAGFYTVMVNDFGPVYAEEMIVEGSVEERGIGFEAFEAPPPEPELSIQPARYTPSQLSVQTEEVRKILSSVGGRVPGADYILKNLAPPVDSAEFKELQKYGYAASDLRRVVDALTEAAHQLRSLTGRASLRGVSPGATATDAAISRRDRWQRFLDKAVSRSTVEWS